MDFNESTSLGCGDFASNALVNTFELVSNTGLPNSSTLAINTTGTTENCFYPWTQPYTPWGYTYTYPSYQVRCAWCQGTHYGKCPDLKAVIYRADGRVERVEFYKEGK